MGETRLTSLAYGKYNNFAAVSANIFVAGDTTPDVTDGILWFTNNVTNTNITDFEFTVVGGGAGKISGNFEGKVLKVVMLDNSTNILNSPRIFTANSAALGGLNSVYDFVYHNSAWYQGGGGSPNQNLGFISVDSNAIKSGLALYPLASTGNVLVTGFGQNITLNLLHDSTGNWTLRRVIGANPGAQLTLIAGGDSHSLVVVNSAANDTFVCVSSASSTQFRLAGSAAIQFVRGLTKWHELVAVNVQSGAAVQGQ